MRLTKTRDQLNMVLRFLLELAALGGTGRLGWQLVEGPLRYALCLLAPALAATAWGTFAVPDDPSRSGRAPVVVRGWQRLTLEALFFALGAYGYFVSERRLSALALTSAVLLHYALSLERIRWLLRR